ncbi:MAG: hypothetical protein ABII12_15705 [Planctomycetota bacterium]
MGAARLIIDEPLAGPLNMARDEALLETCTGHGAPPVLRMYAWSPPTISLGYFQDYAEYENLAPPAGKLAVVRRTTGGGAILHDLEVTYSLTVPVEHPLVADRPNHLYTLAHEAVIAAIGHGVHLLGTDSDACDGSARRGPFFCFARRHGLDVVVDAPCVGDDQLREKEDEPRASARAASRTHGDPEIERHAVAKIAGSAQRRTKQAILQHGSIMLGSRYAQQPVATWSDLAGKSIDFSLAAAHLIPAFEHRLGVSFAKESWHAAELEAADEIGVRYAGADWTIRRQR